MEKSDNLGTLQIPRFKPPLSNYLTKEARLALRAQQPFDPPLDYSAENIGEIRKIVDLSADLMIERARTIFHVCIDQTELSGVKVTNVNPEAGVSVNNRKRILIELHPGAFIMGAKYGVLESLPMAAIGRFKIISIAYRLAPEHQFPAALQDLSAVYKELLKEYLPEHIGIVGSSSGGLLAAQAIPWFERESAETWCSRHAQFQR